MVIYTVEKGDTVYSVGREFGVTPSRIITDNLLTNPGNLVPGQNLIILSPETTHVVKGGETLYRIAYEYGVTVDSLYRNNPVLDGNPTVLPGQTLIVSLPYPKYGDILTMGYCYGNIDEATLRRTLPYLTYLDIFTYGIRGNGELIPPEYGDDGIIEICGEYGTVPILTLTSLDENGRFSDELVSGVLASEELQNAVVSSTVKNLSEKGYGGVNLDFEYVPSERAEDYIEFARKMKSAIGGLPLIVSLAPKYSSDQVGLLYQGHNYKRLGEISDYVLLMTYEWGYTYGPPMAVAPVNQVRRVVDYGITEIDKDKIMMGVPNYGYDWPLPYIRGETKAVSLSNTEAVERAGQRGADIIFDEIAASPYYTYYDRPRSYSDAVEHEVWFENADSINVKMNLLREKELVGTGVWNVTKYFPALWTVINSQFNIVKR